MSLLDEMKEIQRRYEAEIVVPLPDVPEYVEVAQFIREAIERRGK